MYLEEFYDYKNRLMEDLLTSPAIVRLITDDKNDIQNPAALVYRQVHPYEYIPDTVEHGQTFICCDVDLQKSLNDTFYSLTLYIWVFSHKSKLRLPEGGVRTDKLVSEIAKRINASRNYGLGELELYSVKRFAPITDYQGKVMMFQAKDFNHPSPTDKSIPTNRKRG